MKKPKTIPPNQYNPVILTKENQQLIQWIANNPAIAPVTSKMVEDPNRNSGAKENDIPLDIVSDISQHAMTDLRDIRMIRTILPELDTIEEILISSILSPNDMFTEELTWIYEGSLPSKIHTALTEVLKDHFDQTLRLNDMLSDMLKNALFERGSHILAILPESAIDDIINSRSNIAIEDFNQRINQMIDPNTGDLMNKGVLGRGLRQQVNIQQDQRRKAKYAIESFSPTVKPLERRDDDIIPGLLRVTDNIELLKLPNLKQQLRQRRIAEAYQSHSLESVYFNPSMTPETEKELMANKFYREIQRQDIKKAGTVIVNDRNKASRKNIGHPLLLELPHECCIPVFSPGNPKDHLSYLVLLDEEGYPLTLTSQAPYLNNMVGNHQSYFGSGEKSHPNVLSQTLEEINIAMNGKECACKDMKLSQLKQFYARMIEQDLVARLNDGIYGKHVQLANIDEIYRIMLARTLAGTMTQILYIPASLVTYITFYYNEFGVGESLLTRTKGLAALRAAAVYANNTAMVKNAMGSRIVRVTLDEDDTTPDETFSKIANKIIEANSMQELFNTLDPREISAILHRAQYHFVIDGGENFEQTKVEMEEARRERLVIDNEFLTNNKNEYISALQVPGVLLEEKENLQFSSEFIAKNVLFAKRNRRRAMQFNEFIRDFIIKYTLHDGSLIGELSHIIRENYTLLPQDLIDEMKKQNSTIPLIEQYFEDLYPSIPLPDLEKQNSNAESFETYGKLVDTMIENYFNNDIMSAFIDDENDPETVKNMMNSMQDHIKTVMKTKWLADNGLFADMQLLLQADEETKKTLFESMFREQVETARKLSSVINDLRHDYLPNADEQEEGSDYGGSDDSGGGDDDTGTASGDDDEFNFNDGQDDDTEEEEDKEEDKEEEEDTDKEDDAAEDTSSDDSGDSEGDKADA